ncbi:MAG: hypothetical protein D6696_04805 [Acidobacteria bacterium]|nr:MAG: hypothetical protein D6696_04805 [Acidobacteriota bacterium]
MSEGGGKLRITVPDCGCELLVDVKTGEVLSHRKAKEPPAGGKDFDALLAGLGESKAKADEIFSREMSALKERDRLLEEKFEEAKRRAKEEDDGAPPPRPWELD